ncbi:hypothetical protein EH165_14700 [Nakamurella antarctica]|uniref:PH domain-containing protein n=1 Tax=Nakamurella antarctica TaxID=1902245 RepID=A0A3G8ZPK8_9ACTN|nr:hypothetical protein [Nakamurella antarctica]AZI59203.1 hypothetical protein EH165_14700 [Nakamurella antarctica]
MVLELRYPSGTSRRLYEVVSIVCAFAGVGVGIRYGLFGSEIDCLKLLWSDIQYPAGMGLFGGILLSYPQSILFQASETGVTVRGALKKTEFNWAAIESVDLSGSGGLIYLKCGRKVKVVWHGFELTQFMAVRHSLKKQFAALYAERSQAQLNEEPWVRKSFDWIPPVIAVSYSLLGGVSFIMTRLIVI